MWVTQIEKGWDHRLVLITARNDQGQRRRFIVTDFVPYFYVNQGVPIPKIPEIINTVDVDVKEVRGLSREPLPLTRVYLNKTISVVRARDWFHNRGYTTYEADVLYPLRFRIDTGIGRGFLVPKEVFSRERLMYNGQPYKANKHKWWIKPWVPVGWREVVGFA